MRTFFGVCLLVIGGCVLTLLDMLLFFDILAEIRGMLFGMLGLASLVLVALGVLAMKVRRYYVLGMTLLLSSLVIWQRCSAFLWWIPIRTGAAICRRILPNRSAISHWSLRGCF